MQTKINLNNSHETISWHIVYKKLADLLYQFYSKYRENSAKELYHLCMTDSEFLLLNHWTRDYDRWGSFGFDPIHIFSSFNYPRINKDLRIRKLKVYFRILGSKFEFDNISFIGVPTPNITKVMSGRDLKYQYEIWELFSSVVEDKYAGIDGVFEKVDKWYGLNISVVTVFLFWVDSDSFFPLDKNTVRILNSNNNKIPRSSQEYIEMIQENIAQEGVFRKLAKVACE